MLLLSSSSLKGHGLHRVFEIAHNAQYDGIELCVENSDFDTWDAPYLLGLIQEFKVPIYSLSAPSSSMNRTKVDLLIDIAEKIGAKIINFVPPRIIDKDISWYKSYLPKIQKETKVYISAQNITPKFLLFIIPEYKYSTLSQLRGITGNTTLDLDAIDRGSSMDIIKANELLGNTLRNILLRDKNGENHLLIPGMAKGGMSYLPIESLLMKLKNTGYNGFITLKVSTESLGGGDIGSIENNLKNVKAYYEKYFLYFK